MATINHKTYNEGTETFKDFSVYDGKDTLIFKVDGSTQSAAVTGTLAVSGNATFDTSTLVVDAANNRVGIGTSSPASLLHTSGSNNTFKHFTTADNATWIEFQANSEGRPFYVGQDNSTGASFFGAAYAALIVTGTTDPIILGTNSAERLRITSAGNVSIGTTSELGKLTVQQTSAARITGFVGNSNSQGAAQNYRVVRHYPVVSLGTKLIIPFVAQGNLFSTTIVRIFGHSARYNSSSAQGFTADFEVGHLTSIQASSTLSSTGNVASIAASGSNIEITFTNAYTAATADGVYVTIEYMTNNINYSIDVANIAMN